MATFDLTPVLTLPPVRVGRGLHWGSGAFVVFLVLVLGFGWFRFASSGVWTPAQLAGGGIAIVVVVAFVLVFIGTTNQAVRVAVDEDGLRLISGVGTIMKEVRWKSGRVLMDMEWTESTPSQVARGLPARWQLKGYRPFNTYVTREAFEEIVRTANSLGLGVTEVPCPGRPGWTRTSIRST